MRPSPKPTVVVGVDRLEEGLHAVARAVLLLDLAGQLDCPGREPPFLAVKCPARPYKRAMQNRFTARNAKDA